jgi:protein SCO1/2
MKRAAAVLGFLLLAASCNAKSKPKPLDEPGQKVYSMTGKIVSRDGAANTVNLDHEAIPGFMEAMTMDYSVRGVKVDSLPPNGAKVIARLHVADDAYWLTDVKKVP